MIRDFKFLNSNDVESASSSLTMGNAFSYMIYPRHESEVRLPFIWLANDIMTGEYGLDQYVGPIKYFRTYYINLSDSLYRDETATEYLPSVARVHSIEIDDYSIPELTDWDFISEDTHVKIYFKVFTR